MDSRDSNNGGSAQGDKILVRGLVIPIEWDANGRVMAVSIAAFNEEKYLVSENPAGRELVNFVGHEVAAVGTLESVGAKVHLVISDFFSFGDETAGAPDT